MGLPTWMLQAGIWQRSINQVSTLSSCKQPLKKDQRSFPILVGENLDDILCQQEERTVSADNCIIFEGMKLQILPSKYRCHYVRVRVMLHRYRDGSLAIFHGPRKLADYDKHGKLMEVTTNKAA